MHSNRTYLFLLMALAWATLPYAPALGIKPQAAPVCKKAIRAASGLLPDLHTRSSGVLAAMSSLPGKYGVGDFGSAADFIPWLHVAGQSWWQLLPLNPADGVHSPFSSESAFAIDWVYLDPQQLVGQRLITLEELDQHDPALGFEKAHFAAARQMRAHLLDLAFARFSAPSHSALWNAFRRFRIENSDWLKDYAFFRVLRAQYGYDFTRWPPGYRDRQWLAMGAFRVARARAIRRVEFEQFLLHRQFEYLKQHAHSLGIALIGDLPLYVARYSADVWAHPEAFELNADKSPRRVSGYPPCESYKNGQMWGTPVYDWKGLRRSGYDFWVKRMRRATQLFDAVRVDHFLGLHHFYHVDATAKDARNGQWSPGGGHALLAALERKLGPLPLIAEDLGSSIPPELHALREAFGIPGMRIMQFGYGAAEAEGDPFHRVDAYERLSVAFPGNHDMPTLQQWLDANPGLSPAQREPWIRRLMGSSANLVILPLQDVLGLGAEARMNLPGTWLGAPDPEHNRENWVWRVAPDSLTAVEAVGLGKWSRESGR